MNNTSLRRIAAVMMLIVMCITMLSYSASAISVDNRGSITITTLSKTDKEPISGAVFRVYKIANAYADGNSLSFVYTEQFKDNGMNMGNFSDAYLPVHLVAYAQTNSISYIEKTTDGNGKVVFENLSCGAYLVVPAGTTSGYLNPTPFIVAVPVKDETNNSWVYDIDAAPKVESDKTDEDEKTYISVKKYWKGTERTPDSITVSLIKDGAIYDSAILSAADNWYYKWEGLDKNHSWSVVETNVPEGYNVSYVSSQMTVIITNTSKDYEDETTTAPDEATTTDDTTTTEPTTEPDGTTNPEETTDYSLTTKPAGTTKPTSPTENTTKPEELPKTGQLNWPVPVFSIVGMLLFSVGWVMFNFGKKDEEAI